MKDKFNGVVEQLLDAGIFLEEAIEVLEKGMIAGALERTSNNQCAAARMLGIHRNTLQRKIVEFGLAPQKTRRKPAARAGANRKKRSIVA